MKKLNILIVDDIFMNRYLIREIVNDLGHSYVDVENGKLAVEALQKSDFDLVIMDIEMPVMNGIETTLYIKNKMNLGDKEPKIVALTAHDPILFKADYENVPFDNVVTKPYSAEKIKDIITSFFGS